MIKARIKSLQIKTKKKKKAKDMRITYKQAKIPQEEAQNMLNRAFDILFEEVAKKP